MYTRTTCSMRYRIARSERKSLPSGWPSAGGRRWLRPADPPCERKWRVVSSLAVAADRKETRKVVWEGLEAKGRL
jgi:hypothetical protein